ncbi:ABC transporter substrate-binding protein [Aureimonas sp. Leaf324]|jgi:putative spermidine/putrescine transport system substrate-binding protein|uniref:ABC transporter substrate-binding protein n=1 Tax=Aureimonas sp. Leaf324 TaxID=1736336 RepID=UPI0006FF82CF|nr:ABC transporter substrate-binding protein [Aureimonas sp. Leaf324]KQQ80846.1 spermidine/putrescine ABC transporter substrate-binding protein [Aureimonas sp. Leaf324]
MSRSTIRTLVGGLLAASLLAAVPAAARDLTVVSWGGNYQDAQREIYFKPYAAKTGKPVLEESWDGGYGVLSAKMQGGTPNWDAVQVEAEELALGCADGIYEPVDWSKLGGEDKFIPSAVNECGVGAIVWTTGLGYDADKLKEAPKSWADFFDTAKFPGKRALRKGPKYALEFALIADGVEPKEVYTVLATPEGVDRAFKKLDTIKKDLVWWEAGAQPIQLLASGEVVMTSAYNGRLAGINKSEGKNFQIVWPGSIYAVDSWVVLKGSPNKDAAFDFIAFASQPENQSKLPDYIAYGLPNKAAGEMLKPEVAAQLPTAPANLDVAIPLDTDFWVDNIEALNTRFNAWVAQ